MVHPPLILSMPWDMAFGDTKMGRIQILQGDLFKSNAQTFVNAVNCVGVMGKGIAKEFRQRFPDMYEDYVQRCRLKTVKLGEPYLFKRQTKPWIINFPTKGHWRERSTLQDIERGLQYLLVHYHNWHIESLAVPALGCGAGGLPWADVKPLLVCYLSQMDIPVEIYAPLEGGS